MRAFVSLFVALVLVAFALTRAPALTPLPPNPHQSLNATAACSGCHAYYGGTLDPYEFIVPIPDKCRACHSQENLGRSHPIGVDPRHAAEKVEVPDDIPLEDGLVSCGSCHNPHLEFLSKTWAAPQQKATFVQQDGRTEINWYKTYYLRKPDPDKGFEPLCVSCHRDY